MEDTQMQLNAELAEDCQSRIETLATKLARGLGDGWTSATKPAATPGSFFTPIKVQHTDGRGVSLRFFLENHEDLFVSARALPVCSKGGKQFLTKTPLVSKSAYTLSDLEICKEIVFYVLSPLTAEFPALLARRDEQEARDAMPKEVNKGRLFPRLAEALEIRAFGLDYKGGVHATLANARVRFRSQADTDLLSIKFMDLTEDEALAIVNVLKAQPVAAPRPEAVATMGGMSRFIKWCSDVTSRSIGLSAIGFQR
jgi:hypothetical protein